MKIMYVKNGFALYIDTEGMKKKGGGMRVIEISEVIEDLRESIVHLKLCQKEDAQPTKR